MNDKLLEVDESLSALEEQLRRVRDLNRTLETAADANKQISRVAEDLADQLQKVNKAHLLLCAQADQVYQKIEQVDFPTRLDIIRNGVAETTAAVKALGKEVEGLRDLLGNVAQHQERLHSKVQDFHQEAAQRWRGLQFLWAFLFLLVAALLVLQLAR